jgi:dTDP-4-amino-4,6-dideoxygalactose transaminase
LLQLKHIDEALQKREAVDQLYREKLSNIKGIKIVDKVDGIESNYSYFPILIEEEYPLRRDELYRKLKSENIFARRYFHPLISDAEPYKQYPSSEKNNLKVAKSIADKVLCLPLFPNLDDRSIQRIINCIKEN